jgi:hypothetical protein
MIRERAGARPYWEIMKSFEAHRKARVSLGHDCIDARIDNKGSKI